MTKPNPSNAGPLLAVAFSLFLAAVFWLSSALGAHQQTALEATARSLPVLIVVDLLVWYLPLDLFAAAAAAIAVLWPNWWKVVDSIAVGGEHPGTAFMVPWWASDSTKYVVEVLLVAFAGWLYYKRQKTEQK